MRIVREPWGIKLEMNHAPASAFVDGDMIRGVKEHLFSVLRDIVYTHNEIVARFDLTDPASVTNAIFCILRNARALEYKGRPDLVVCWGGHSIPREEYDYTKKVGYELGLRGPVGLHRLRPGRDEGPDEGRDHRPLQAAHQGRPLRRRHRARDHRGGAAEPDREPARDHAGHREAPRSLRPHVPRHHRVPGRGGHGGGNPLPARHPARPGQCRPAAAAGVHRAARERRLFPPAGPLHRAHARRGGAEALPDHRRRPAGGRARDAARLRPGAPLAPARRRRLQLQLAAAGSRRLSSSPSS